MVDDDEVESTPPPSDDENDDSPSSSDEDEKDDHDLDKDKFNVAAEVQHDDVPAIDSEYDGKIYL